MNSEEYLWFIMSGFHFWDLQRDRYDGVQVMKKLLVATALLAAGTSTVLAQGVFRYGPSGATADRLGGYVDPSYVQGNRGYYDYAPGPLNYSGTVSGQPSPDSGIESQR
jgi:hypothetical protein